MLGYGAYDDTLNALERAITPGPYILGDWLTAADICVASLISWELMPKTLDARPAFQAYLGRCTNRPPTRAPLHVAMSLRSR